MATPSNQTGQSPFSGQSNQGTTPDNGTPSQGGFPSFHTDAPASLPEGPAKPGTPGAASSFDENQTGAPSPAKAAPTTFSLPGFYGQGPKNFTVGEGRLARPKFRITGNIAVGFDDNVLQTPTHALGVPDQKVKVLVDAGSPATTKEVRIPSGDPAIPDTFLEVPVAAVAPKFRTTTIPGTPPPERIGSWITRTDATWDIQFASRRTLFTFDLTGGVDYYWNRPGKKSEYNGNLSLIYLRKISGRAQFTATINTSYQVQPDFSQVNSPTNDNRGAYLTANAKADFSYRLTPRISSVTSISYDTVKYEESDQQGGDYAATTFGTELRYLFSPRFTMVGELRYRTDSHDQQPQSDTDTYYFLLGGDFTLSRRFMATVRIGETVQTFKEGGGKASSPYLETTLNYQFARGSFLQWNVRYGYEEPGIPNARLLVARTGISVSQIFGPRFQVSLGVNLLRSDQTIDGAVTTAAVTNSDGTITPGTTTTGTTDNVQNTIDATLGFKYTLDRHWSLSLSYSYTTVLGPADTDDYYRQRVFLGFAYQF